MAWSSPSIWHSVNPFKFGAYGHMSPSATPPPPPPATPLQSSVFESQHRVNLSFLLQNTDVNHKQCSSNVEKEGYLLRWKTIETFEWYRGSGWWTWLTRDKIIGEICPINVLGRGLYGEVAIMSRMLKYFGHGVRHTDMKNSDFFGVGRAGSW